MKHSSSHYCFDGQSQSESKLMMSELSHFWTEGKGFCSGCFEGNYEECTADESIYKFTEVLTERNNDGGTRTTSDRTKATAHRLTRATEFFGRRRPAKAGDWVLVYLSDVGDARNSQLGSDLVPVRLVDGKVLYTGAMRRAHVMAFWPAAVKFEAEFSEVDGAAQAVPLEKVISPLIQLGVLQRRASSSSSSSSTSSALSAAPARAVYVLPPGALQAAKALIARDKELFPADALL